MDNKGLLGIEDYTVNRDEPLYPDQQDAIRFMLAKRYCIVALQTGLGKTYACLTAMYHAMTLRSDIRGVVICPPAAVKIFKKELTQKLGYSESEIGFLTSENVDVDGDYKKVYIVTYTYIQKFKDFLPNLSKKYKLVCVMDEAHKLQAKETKVKTYLTNIKSCFSVIWLATATPLLNDIEGLYRLVSFLDNKFLGTKTSFLNKYAETRLKDIYIKGGKKRKVREILGVKNAEQLREKLSDICIMRQKQYNLKFGYVSDSLTDFESSIYEQISAGVLQDEERTFSGRMHDLQRIVDNSYDHELIIRDIATKEKLFLKTVKKIMSKGLSVVVYVDYLDTLSRLRYFLEKNKKDVGYREIFEISGSIERKERESVESRIDRRDIILITSAGSQSINLQRANCVMFYDIPYSVGMCLQVIGRITRADTEFDTQYIFVLYIKGTIDEYKYLLFLDNSKLIKDIIGSDANMPKELQEIDRKNMDKLREKFLWHFKDDNKKIVRRNKKLVRNNLSVATSKDYFSVIGSVYINLNPVKNENMKTIGQLIADKEIYDLHEKDPKLFEIKYRDFLRSVPKEVLIAICRAICYDSKVLVLVDDYGCGDSVKEFILDSLEDLYA